LPTDTTSVRRCRQVERLAAQFLRALRGRRSASGFSKLLGYKSNPVRLWEAGKRFPTALEALRICERLGRDVGEAFATFVPRPASIELTDEGLAELMDQIRAGLAIGVVADRLGRSRYTVGRWLAAQSRPRLPDFLAYMDVLTGRAIDFVALLVPVERLPAARELMAAKRAAQRLSAEEPWAGAILRMLDTNAYRALAEHREGWLAERLGIPVALENKIIEAFAEAKIIALRGGRYQAIGELRLYRTKRTLVKQHWSRVAIQRIEEPSPGDYTSVVICSLSRADLDEIRQRLRRVFREILADVTASKNIETVAVINLQLLEFDPDIG
jgi:transcriptional regulator with XRE-family HTH domain